MKSLAALSLVSAALAIPEPFVVPSCDNPPAKGYDGPKDGGLFSISFGGAAGPGGLSTAGKGTGAADPGLRQAPKKWEFLCKSIQGSTFPVGPEYPKTGVKRTERPGTGPYKSHPAGRTDPSLPDHTIYAPIAPPPADVKLPVIVFGEGGCTGTS
jgi:hypothetical protein